MNYNELAAQCIRIVCDQLHGEGQWSWSDDLRHAQFLIAEELRRATEER